MAIEFEDASGRFRSRLISHPCKDPRGKHKADVFLDEFAHYGHKQRGIYVAAVPIVSRGNGQLTIGSTPLMVGDLFHEIVKEERRKYPMLFPASRLHGEPRTIAYNPQMDCYVEQQF